ncbi:hypothetical protein NP233_g6206 [Leucocoprinus birnbaumii]|uniref:MYND-type domain-containing protein n=1 Tax=Leucocoprinus birnbaumii TaxID=56174 RepID=A0AAD5VRF6_9AGAR|nr:hypothetical protein NP233_g6206 [Leucocoprinus birnbaumii]
MDPSIWNDVQIHPNVDGELFLAGAGLDDQALSLQKQGDYLGAEKVYLQALQLKLAGAGDDHITTAQTRNGLGELYIIMRKFDEAEDQLKRALAVFKAINSQTLDAPVTIENLAQVYEGKGDLQKALDTRLSGDPNRMVCSNTDCMRGYFKKGDLKTCSICKVTFYCGKDCQASAI